MRPNATDKLTSAWWTAGAFLLAILACPHRALAQSAVPLSLDDAIARSLASAPKLAEAQSRVAAATAAVTSRQSQGRPSVAVSGGYLRTNHIDEFGIALPNGTVDVLFPDIPNNYQARADLTLPLYTSGRVEALVSAATDEVHATEAERDAASHDLVLEVTQAYWTLVTTREQVRVVQQAIERLDAYVSDVRARVDTGFLPPNDLLSAESQRSRRSVALIDAQNGVAVASADLARLVGLPLETTIEPTTALATPVAGVASLMTESTDALVAAARAARPERVALSERADEARATGRAAASAKGPQFGVSAGVQPARPNDLFVPRTDTWRTSWSAGVSVSWLLWDSGRSAADRAAALAQADEVSHRLDDFDATLGVEILQRMLDVKSRRAALAASTDAVAAATEARRVVQERFAAGVATGTDVLDAEGALLEAQLEQTQIQAALRVGEARLLRAVGRQP